MEGIQPTESRSEKVELSPEKRELLKLEKEGWYVFHGSGVDVDTLEPRQAMDIVRGKEGDPAVFASDKADYAIFMAIVNKQNCPQGALSHAGSNTHEDGSIELVFGMSKATNEQLKDSASGFVYVFDKTGFVHRGKEWVEFMSYTPIKPLRKIRVTKQDLPEHIEITEE